MTYDLAVFEIFSMQWKKKTLLRNNFFLFYERIWCILILQTQGRKKNQCTINLQTNDFQDIWKTGNNIIPQVRPRGDSKIWPHCVSRLSTFTSLASSKFQNILETYWKPTCLKKEVGPEARDQFKGGWRISSIKNFVFYEKSIDDHSSSLRDLSRIADVLVVTFQQRLASNPASKLTPECSNYRSHEQRFLSWG